MALLARIKKITKPTCLSGITAFILTSMLLLLTTAQANYLENTEVRSFVKSFVKKHGGSTSELGNLFAHAKQQTGVLESIAKPAERTLTWATYRPIFLTSKRIKEGAAFWNQHETLLNQAEKQFGVPPEIIVGIIGVETYYGKITGRHPVFDSLTTLAFDYPPRAKFFRSELEQFLLLAKEENFDPTEVVGSYAGAMGYPQFISSSYRRYAIDFDGDNKRDLRSNIADAIGSIGNYFQHHGWQKNKLVSQQVIIRDERYKSLVKKSLKPTITTAQLRDVGILLPQSIEGKHTVLALAGQDGPQLWVSHENFYVITRYNHSHLYAMAVHQLGQSIAKKRTQSNNGLSQ